MVIYSITVGDVESGVLTTFMEEIQMMKRVSSGDCVHVVHLIAASSCADPTLIVMELAAFGSLLDYLHNSRPYAHVSIFKHRKIN